MNKYKFKSVSIKEDTYNKLRDFATVNNLSLSKTVDLLLELMGEI